MHVVAQVLAWPSVGRAGRNGDAEGGGPGGAGSSASAADGVLPAEFADISGWRVYQDSDRAVTPAFSFPEHMQVRIMHCWCSCPAALGTPCLSDVDLWVLLGVRSLCVAGGRVCLQGGR